MAEAMRMPALGQTSDELRIIGWLKAEGESLALGEPLLEVETDKAALTVESALSGTLLKIVQPAEATIPSGTVIAYIGRPGEQLAADLVESSEARPPAISSDDVSSRAAREGASAVP
jgi:pyruvate dehydrogenase E2 component (dihydrolipoamide acetyltransferase)